MGMELDDEDNLPMILDDEPEESYRFIRIWWWFLRNKRFEKKKSIGR